MKLAFDTERHSYVIEGDLRPIKVQAIVTLYKESGKWYTNEVFDLPELDYDEVMKFHNYLENEFSPYCYKAVKTKYLDKDVHTFLNILIKPARYE